MGKGFDIAGGESLGDNFALARDAGFTFGFVKLYQAPYGVDRGFASAWPRMLAAGVRRGAYIFPDYRPGAASPRAQVAAAYAEFVRCGGWSDGDIAIAIDVEFPGGHLPQGITGIVAFLASFVDEVTHVFGCRPILYTSARVWDGTDTDALRGPISWITDECPLWVKTGYVRAARQPLPDFVPSGRPKMPRAWELPSSPGAWINQWDGDVIGIPGMVATADVNRPLNLNRDNAGDAAELGRVRWVRRKLGLGLAGGWDVEMQNALAAFQGARGLVTDLDIGIGTFAALSRIAAP